jgi:hypothetical protein
VPNGASKFLEKNSFSIFQEALNEASPVRAEVLAENEKNQIQQPDGVPILTIGTNSTSTVVLRGLDISTENILKEIEKIMKSNSGSCS